MSITFLLIALIKSPMSIFVFDLSCVDNIVFRYYDCFSVQCPFFSQWIYSCTKIITTQFNSPLYNNFCFIGLKAACKALITSLSSHLELCFVPINSGPIGPINSICLEFQCLCNSISPFYVLIFACCVFVHPFIFHLSISPPLGVFL